MTPIFITGYERSGTTLARRLVSMHPDVGYDVIHEGKERFLACKNAKVADKQLTFPSKLGGELTGGTTSIRAGIKLPYTSFAMGKSHVEHFMRLFPEGRIVHIIRDPVYAVNSQVRTFRKPEGRSVEQYFESVPQMVKLLKKFPDVYVISYEALTGSPAENIKSLYDWIGGEVSAEYIEKVMSNKDAWEHDGRVMCGLKYFDHIKSTTELTLSQKTIDRINIKRG